MSTYSVEVVYRGIFQKHLGVKICRGIVLAAVKEGKRGIAFGRYGDSPERNGIPAKQFAIVADTEEELQISMAQYEPKETDVSIAVDDTLCKGVESWAWYGLQPINKLLKKDGTLLVTSMEEPDALLAMAHTKEVPYHIAVVKGTVSFSGLWVYKDDHTDVRVLGAVAKVAPHLVRIGSVEQAILEEWGDELKVKSARKSYDRTEKHLVAPGTGNPEVPYTFEMPKWQEMREGLVIPAIPVREQVEGWDGGYRPGRNPTFKKFSTRTMRPVVDFEKCTKCTLCWLQCPDSCFDITPDGFYDANMQACCGCGVCEAVCPVENCITMVNETAFPDNASQWEAWQKDKDGYRTWVQQVITNRPARSHGFSHVTQYKRELAEMRKTETVGEVAIINEEPGAGPG
ncbi:MAG: (4Fe-4S)-binding protein [candidate division NC10 bacterium]|nr:(4Fe-4S)-binding protein [candidate division NC10 bacterium]